jgi:uncharacterized protein (TIGR02271 family)
MRTVIGLFDRFEDAQAAVQDLRSEGFTGDDISMVSRDASGEYSRYFEGDRGEETQNIADGAAAGAGIGAVLGGLGGFLVGLGALAIPGVGPVLAAGPLAAALAGAGLGAVAGGLLGALIDMGIPEEHAEYYAEGVRRGGTLVVVRAPDDQADRVVSILNNHNPIDVERRAQEWRQKNWSGFDPHAGELTREEMEFNRMREDQNIPVTGAPTAMMDRDRTLDRDHDTTIPIIEEEMRVGKREVERGGLEVETHIEEVPVDEEIRLRRERIDVDRRPVDRPATDKDFENFKEGKMEFTETDEEAIVQKHSRVVEEVHIDKDVEEDVEHIHDTVRRTDVEIHDRDRMRGSQMNTPSDFNQYDTGFRSHYQSFYTNRGHDYNYYMPAYQYGYTLANDRRYSDYDWNRLEMEARRDWERDHRDSPWEDVKDAVRHAWNTIRGY